MNKVLILLALIGVVLAVPVRLRTRYTLPDTTFNTMASTANSMFGGDLFLAGDDKIAVIKSGMSNITNILTVPNVAITALAIHPTKAQLIVAYIREATAAEQTANPGIVVMGGVARITIDANYVGTLGDELLVHPVMCTECAAFADVAFGGDNYLYIGAMNANPRAANGRRDVALNGNSKLNFHGKILRIDVDGKDADPSKKYLVPSSNPYKNVAGYAEEIFAMGFSAPGGFSWYGGSFVTLDNNEQGFVNEFNIVKKESSFGFPAVIGSANKCYASEPCTATGTAPVADIPAGSLTGVALYDGRFVVSTNTSMTWFTTSFSEQGSVRLMDFEGYDFSLNQKNFEFSAMHRHTVNGTVFLMGAGQAKKNFIYSLEPENSAAAVRASVLALLVAVLVMLL